ncbi:MAG: FTR1 family protein [Anaerolineales bacterium]
MFPSYLLSLREGIEAALIIGIVLGALRQMRRTELIFAIWAGVVSAATVSLIAAVLLTGFGLSLGGKYEPIFEGVTLFLAAGVLTWMIFWMQINSRHIKGELESGVRRAVMTTGKRGLFALAFIAVVREGIELALFLTASVFASNAAQTIVGALLGLFTAVLLGWAIFATAVKLDLRRFFKVTGVLLVLFAAGLVSLSVHEFNEVGWIPGVIEHVWNLSPILSDSSLLGQILKTLFGYDPSPSLSSLMAYVAYFVAVWFGLIAANKTDKAPVQTQA